MSEHQYHPLRCSFCGENGHTLLQCQRTRPADWKLLPPIDPQAALSQPAPQGVADVYVQDDVVFLRERCRELVQERDALKADKAHYEKVIEDRNREAHQWWSALQVATVRVAELEGDAARDAARYRYLRNLPIEKTGLPGQPCIAMPNGMQSGYYLTEETADHAVDTSMADIAIAASKATS